MPFYPAAQLLFFHPGGFLIGSPQSQEALRDWARARGWRGWLMPYPLGNVAEAMAWSRSMASSIAARYGPTYAWGGSAGGAIAARLAQEGRVNAAACLSPVPSVWRYLTENPGGIKGQQMLQATEAEADDASPMLHVPSAKPIRVMGGTKDPIAHPEDLTSWDRSDARVSLRMFDGGHLGGQPGTARALVRWLEGQP